MHVEDNLVTDWKLRIKNDGWSNESFSLFDSGLNGGKIGFQMMDETHKGDRVFDNFKSERASDNQHNQILTEESNQTYNSCFTSLDRQYRKLSTFSPEINKSQLLLDLLESTRSLKFLRIDFCSSIKKLDNSSKVNSNHRKRGSFLKKLQFNRSDNRSFAPDSPIPFNSINQTPHNIFTKIDPSKTQSPLNPHEMLFLDIFKYGKNDSSPIPWTVIDRTPSSKSINFGYKFRMEELQADREKEKLDANKSTLDKKAISSPFFQSDVTQENSFLSQNS